MDRKKRVVFTGIIAVGLLVYAAFGIADYFKGSHDRYMQGLGNELMEEIKAYQYKEKHLPQSLKEMGYEDGEEGSSMYKGEPFFYTLWNDTVFSLEYPLDMERNMGRLSNQKEWDVTYVVFVRK